MTKLKPLTINDVKGKQSHINDLASCNRTPIPGPVGPVGPTGMAGPNTPLFSSVEKVTNATNLAPSGVSLINSFNAGYNVELSASTTGAIKSLILDYDTGSQDVVNTPRGSVFVQPGLPVRNMVYTNEPYWTSLDPNYTSFFPTTLNTTGIVGSNYIGQSYQGYSTAISDDGNTLAVGGPLDNVSVGAVWIYTQSGGVWTQQGQKLIAQDNAGVLGQGCGVALSGDGNTLAVGAGAPGFTTQVQIVQIGATWIWTRSGGVWTEQTKLVGTGYTGNSGQGVSVALSTDGQTLAVGGSNDNNGIGAVWIFTQSGGVWSQEGDKLVGTGGGGNQGGNQGYRVSLSGDGNTLAVGGPQDNNSIGATWIFTRSGGVWTQYGSKLVGTGGYYEQGTSVTLSADGNTLAISSGDNKVGGAFTWIFIYNGTTWSQQVGPLNFNPGLQSSYLSRDGNTLIISGDTNGDYTVRFFTRSDGTWPQIGSIFYTGYLSIINNYNNSPVLSYDNSVLALGIAISTNYSFSPPGTDSGVVLTFNQSSGNLTNQQTLIGTNDSNSPFITTSLNLSADGNTLAMGGNNDNSRIGASWIFTRSSGTWTQQGDKLVGTGYTGNSNQGVSVALSADGNTLAVGGITDNNSIGAVWIFTQSGGVSTQQGDKLAGTGNIGSSSQGASVALSADGNTLAVGGSNDNNAVGATWIWIRSNGVWTQQGNKLVSNDYSGNPEQGHSVALSADGSTLAVGGYTDNNNIGATWIFTRSNGVWTQQGNKLVSNDYSGNPEQGYIVSLSSDGNTLAVVSPSDNNIGAVWVWTRSGIQWTQQGSKLVLNNNTSPQIVALSADGNTLAIYSIDNANTNTYTTIYTRTSNKWFQQPSSLVPGGANTGFFGLALNKSGDTMAVIKNEPSSLTNSVSIFN